MTIASTARSVLAVQQAIRYRRLRILNIAACVFLAAEGSTCWQRATAWRCRLPPHSFATTRCGSRAALQRYSRALCVPGVGQMTLFAGLRLDPGKVVATPGALGRSPLASPGRFDGRSMSEEAVQDAARGPWRVNIVAEGGDAMPATERGEAPFTEVQGDQRERVRRHLDKRTLLIDVVSYMTGNLFLVIVWAISGKGDFWPRYFIAFGGLLLLFEVCLRKPIRPLAIYRDELHRKFPPNGR